MIQKDHIWNCNFCSLERNNKYLDGLMYTLGIQTDRPKQIV